jgi:hypothetical protein
MTRTPPEAPLEPHELVGGLLVIATCLTVFGLGALSLGKLGLTVFFWAWR